jgi:hypothetical protein
MVGEPFDSALGDARYGLITVMTAMQFRGLTEPVMTGHCRPAVNGWRIGQG